MLDYDFAEKGKRMESGVGLFGAIEVAQRQYDIACEIKDYLQKNPHAAVVNLGCGLDDTFRKCDNGICLGYNIDMPDVTDIRNEILPAGVREKNLGYNLNDDRWMDEIPNGDGAVFLPQVCSTISEPRRLRLCFPRWQSVFRVLLSYLMPVTKEARR
jgi:O-methyltransferase involved in polyketide biosynthesis